MKNLLVMASLIKLLGQLLLMEGRVEAVLRKYHGKISPETINKFVEAQNQIDPAINNKYLDWMVKEYINGNNVDDIINAVTVWHQNLNKIDAELIANRYPTFSSEKDLQRIINNPKDINSYTNLEYLKTIGKDAQNKLSKSEEDKIIQNETRLVYNDNQYQIRVPLTHRASCKYGRGSAWCTRHPDTNKYFQDYTQDGILFYIIDKTMSARAEHPMFKIAVLMNKHSGTVHIFNARNNEIGQNLNWFFPPEMINAMQAYRRKYVFDMDKLTQEINKKLGTIGDTIQGWIFKNNVNGTIITNGRYNIVINVNLKEHILKLDLMMNNKKVASAPLTIPAVMIKDIEDIVVEHNSNPAMIEGWIHSLMGFINQSWGEVMNRFQPIMGVLDIYQIIKKRINQYTGNWHFVSDEIPTEDNRQITFKSVRTIPVEGIDYIYTLVVILDMRTQHFILKAEEKSGSHQTELYEDQKFPFDESLLKNETKLIKAFLEWVQEIVATVYDEQWERYTETDDPKELNKLTGQYTSKKYGDFTVEIDSDNKIHVFANNLGAHYVINNIKAFTDTIINKYGLTKIK